MYGRRALRAKGAAALRVVRSHLVTAAVLAILAGLLSACATRAPEVPVPPPVAAPAPAPQGQRFEATAYSIDGKTASGQQARPGVVAADPKILPIGSRIRVSDAGAYSGEYSVEDTGRAIKGHEIDIYIADAEEARRFGRRAVRVEVIGGR
jgi:3D (Asp-Asp-Asp) domain-containing protein